MPKQDQKRPGITWPLAAAAIAITLGLAGMSVALAFAGWKPESIVGFVIALGSGLGAVLGVVGKMMIINADQSERIEEIAENTNGNLRRIIQTEVRSAIGQSVTTAVQSAYGTGRDHEASGQ